MFSRIASGGKKNQGVSIPVETVRCIAVMAGQKSTLHHCQKRLIGIGCRPENMAARGFRQQWRTCAVLYSLISKCPLNNAKPEKWLHYVIEHIKDRPVNLVRDLSPSKIALNENKYQYGSDQPLTCDRQCRLSTEPITPAPVYLANVVSMDDENRHPTMYPANTTTQTKPCHGLTQVKSSIHNWLVCSATN